MAHYAELDANNIVLRVIVVSNMDTVSDAYMTQYPETTKDDLKDVKGSKIPKNGTDVTWEDEQKGKDFCHNLLGGNWIQTSYNDGMRYRFAGKGYTYRSDKNAFVEPQPYPSWKLDKDFNWIAPKARPNDLNEYYWSEDAKNWVLVT